VDLASARSLVIVKPSSLGDVVHALPVASFLKRAHPHLEVRWLVNSELSPLLEGNPDVAGTIEFPRREMRGWSAGWRAVRFGLVLRRLPPADVVCDLQGLLRSALMAKQLRPRWSVGLRGAREGAGWFYDLRVPVDPGAHAVERYLALPRALGVACPAGEAAFPLPVGEPVAGLPGGYVALHPFAKGGGKALAGDQVRRFCEALAPVPVAVVGKPDTATNRTGWQLPANATDLSGATSLAQLVSVLRGAAFVVSTDSGPAHLAAAVNPRLLAIHTWTDPQKVGPFPPGPVVWKAGVIAPRGDLPAGVCARAEQPDSAALAAIAEYVHARLGGAPRQGGG
jgi:ADP-heptose:LPS heptosyltransferase